MHEAQIFEIRGLRSTLKFSLTPKTKNTYVGWLYHKLAGLGVFLVQSGWFLVVQNLVDLE